MSDQPTSKRVGRGLEKPHKCYKCPMRYHDKREYALHLKHYHGIIE